MACVTVGVLGALGASAGLAASQSGNSPSAPNYGETTAQTLQDQINEAPAEFAAEANTSYGQPAYSGLTLQDLNTLLTGTAGGQQNQPVNVIAGTAGWYNPSGSLVSQGTWQPWNGSTTGTNPVPASGFHGGAGYNNAPVGSGTGQFVAGKSPGQGDVWLTSGQKYTFNNPVNVPAEPGLESQLASANTAQRSADIQDVQNLGPEATQAMLNADPYNAQLLATLNQQANSELAAGSSLTPEEQREAQQQSDAAYAARGLGGGNQAVAGELFNQFSLGQQLLQQRQQFAQGIVGLNQSVIGDPFQQILARSSGAIPDAQQSQSQSGPTLFNPQAGLGLASSNYATQMQTAAANNPLAQLGNVLGGVGKLAGGLGSAY